MKNIIVGYADPNAGAETGIPLKTENGALIVFSDEDFDKSKLLHRFPQGVKQLKSFMLEEIDSSVFISDEIGAFLENSESDRKAKADKDAAERKAKATAISKVSAAQGKIRDAAKFRNDLMGKLHQAQTRLENHNNTPEDLRGKLHVKAVAEIKSLILGDPEKNVAGLQKQVDDAIAAYDAAVAEANPPADKVI
jgi:hypothetical protein